MSVSKIVSNIVAKRTQVEKQRVNWMAISRSVLAGLDKLIPWSVIQLSPCVRTLQTSCNPEYTKKTNGIRGVENANHNIVRTETTTGVRDSFPGVSTHPTGSGWLMASLDASLRQRKSPGVRHISSSSGFDHKTFTAAFLEQVISALGVLPLAFTNKNPHSLFDS